MMQNPDKVVFVLSLALISSSCGGGSAPESERARESAIAEWSASVEPVQLPAATGSSAPQLTSSSRGVIVSWIEGSSTQAELKYAEKTAEGWSRPRTVSAGVDWFVNWADLPSVFRMANGRLVASWLQGGLHPYIEAYNLRLSYSDDEGMTWAPPLSPHHDGTKTQHGFASLFDLPNNGLGVVWVDGRATELDTTDPFGGSMSLRYASFDSAWNQTSESEIDGRVCECCSTAAAETADGVIVAYRDRDDNEIRDIHVARLSGSAWSESARVHDDGWEIFACPVNGPALSARGRQVAAAWFTGIDDHGKTHVAFSNDSGRTWGDPIRLDDNESLGQPDLELMDDGSVVASWIEFANRRPELRLRRLDAAGTRSPAIVVGGGGRPSGRPQMARNGGELVLAWTESAERVPGQSEDVVTINTAVVRVGE